MPSTTEGLLLVAGILFVMIALIGGGFEISAAKIPPVGKKARVGSAIMGLLFLAFAFRSISTRDARPKADSPPAAAVIESVRTPIDNLFKAWEENDLDAYLDQWHRKGRQWIGDKNRTMPEIAERRRNDFERYRRVQVIDYKVDIDEATTDPRIARVTYSMRFQRPDGTWISETDRRETYKLTFLKEQNRWVILENFDYFTK